MTTQESREGSGCDHPQELRGSSSLQISLEVKTGTAVFPLQTTPRTDFSTGGYEWLLWTAPTQTALCTLHLCPRLSHRLRCEGATSRCMLPRTQLRQKHFVLSHNWVGKHGQKGENGGVGTPWAWHGTVPRSERTLGKTHPWDESTLGIFLQTILELLGKPKISPAGPPWSEAADDQDALRDCPKPCQPP